MAATAPITIRRSVIGYLVRILWGIGAIALLFLALAAASLDGSLPGSLLPVVLLYVIAVAFGTFLSMYSYSLSFVVLTDTGITVHNWFNLFSSDDAEMSWYRVQSADARRAGVVGELFGYGTLTISEAGTNQPIYLTYCPNAEYWANTIAQRANASPAPVHEVGGGA